MHPMDALIREWTNVSKHDKRIDGNALLIYFLGTWLYNQYQPFPEKPPFWTRLFQWLDQVQRPRKASRHADQQALFNFVPWLLFVGEEDLIATYRAAYNGPVCRWLIQHHQIELDDPRLDERLEEARLSTWFGSLAGMDINTFCRVNGIFGQSYRPEFRFLAEFCDLSRLSDWLKRKRYSRIVIVEDIVGTGMQLIEAKPALAALRDFQVLFVPLFIAPEGHDVAKAMIAETQFRHVQFEPMFVLPHECIVKRVSSPKDSPEISEFRKANRRHNNGQLGIGDQYGTLVLTHANCPDNCPPIIHERTVARPAALFPRASREG